MYVYTYICIYTHRHTYILKQKRAWKYAKIIIVHKYTNHVDANRWLCLCVAYACIMHLHSDVYQFP